MAGRSPSFTAHSCCRRREQLTVVPKETRALFNRLRIPHRSALSARATIDEDVSTSINFGIACSQGPRSEMEDELCVIPGFSGGVYAGVFDGHGGDSVAKWLNDNLQDFVGPALAQSGNYEAALQAAFHAADAEVLELLKDENPQEGLVTVAGSTASVVVARPNEIISANIGDSSAVLQRDGRQVLLSREHRVFGKSKNAMAEIQRVRDTGGWVSRDGRVCDVLAVSRAFGDPEFKGDGLTKLLEDGVKAQFWTQKFANTVEFSSDPVIATPAVTYTEVSEEGKDEFVVLASDGLWDFWSVPGVMQCARDSLILGASEQAVADILVDKAIMRYTSDNVAVIVLTFPWTQSLLHRAPGTLRGRRRRLP